MAVPLRGEGGIALAIRNKKYFFGFFFYLLKKLLPSRLRLRVWGWGLEVTEFRVWGSANFNMTSEEPF